jgi:RNA polymerase sigma-70 factor (ECF subfamily)
LADDLRSALVALLPRLRRFGLALTGSAVEADELVQGTCERVLSRIGQLRDHSRLDAWVYGIMRNMWIDEVRSRRVRRHDELTAASDVVGADGEAIAEDRITLERVRRTLTQLSEEQRSVLMLVCVDGLTYKEAAARLDIPLGTVMSRLSRARQELQARLFRDQPAPDSVASPPARPARGALQPD